MSNGWVKWILMEEMQWRTNLSNETIEKIASGFMEKMGTRRLTIVPTYLSDEMFEAQRTLIGSIDYTVASSLYRAALDEHNSHTDLPEEKEEIGDF